VNTWKAIFAALVIFGAGVVTGGVLVWRLESSTPAPVNRNPGTIRTSQNVSAGGMRLEFLRRVQRELDLSLEQRERIDKILKDGQERTRKIMEPVAPEFHAELQRAKDEFRSVLTPDQQERFDELVRQHRSHDDKHPSRDRPTAAVLQTNGP
jgi:hypothetical protein